MYRAIQVSLFNATKIIFTNFAFKWQLSQEETFKRHVAYIHERKKPVKFVTLSIKHFENKRGPEIDMSILFMKERNLSNFLQ